MCDQKLRKEIERQLFSKQTEFVVLMPPTSGSRDHDMRGVSHHQRLQYPPVEVGKIPRLNPIPGCNRVTLI